MTSGFLVRLSPMGMGMSGTKTGSEFSIILRVTLRKTVVRPGLLRCPIEPFTRCDTPLTSPGPFIMIMWLFSRSSRRGLVTRLMLVWSTCETAMPKARCSPRLFRCPLPTVGPATMKCLVARPPVLTVLYLVTPTLTCGLTSSASVLTLSGVVMRNTPLFTFSAAPDLVNLTLRARLRSMWATMYPCLKILRTLWTARLYMELPRILRAIVLSRLVPLPPCLTTTWCLPLKPMWKTCPSMTTSSTTFIIFRGQVMVQFRVTAAPARFATLQKARRVVFTFGAPAMVLSSILTTSTRLAFATRRTLQVA